MVRNDSGLAAKISQKFDLAPEEEVYFFMCVECYLSTPEDMEETTTEAGHEAPRALRAFIEYLNLSVRMKEPKKDDEWLM